MDSSRARSFGSVAEIYDRYRPGPPAELARVLGPLRGREVLEIAAGTGLVTRFLESLGADVTIVEPDDDMRAVLTRRSPEVRALCAVAESLPFDDATFDVVVTSSAWHWFNQPEATNEIARVLRDGGDLFVLGNGFRRGEAWIDDVVALRDIDDSTTGGVRAHELVFEDEAPFVEVEKVSVDWTWARDVESVVQLFRTYSGVIIRSEADRDRLDDLVRERLASYVINGVVEIPMNLRGVRVHRRPRGD